jgi:glycosyltransferase involved in cell wall biosynthesis
MSSSTILPQVCQTGWPWTKGSSPFPNHMLDGSSWPKVSIVIPSYNQGEFIEENIRSILLQGYPNLELFIIDGGSTDKTIEIIKKYEPWITYWISEPDNGQAYAINKGWQMSTGEILAWLNSDDYYAPNALNQAVRALTSEHAGMIYSDAYIIDEHGNYLRDWISRPFNLTDFFTYGCFILQHTAFYKREILQEVNWLDESLQMIMDTDLFIRIGLEIDEPLIYLPDHYFAYCREHPGAKTSRQFELFAPEQKRIWDKVFSRDDISQELKQVKKFTYSKLYFTWSTFKLRNGNGRKAIHYLIKSFLTNPKYPLSRLLDCLYIIKEATIILLKSIIKNLFMSQ